MNISWIPSHKNSYQREKTISMENNAQLEHSVDYEVQIIHAHSHPTLHPCRLFFQSCQKQVQSTYTLGSSKAPVHITLFQEFACPACKDFENEVAPRIIKTYVNTGKAQLTFVPTAFLDQSRNAFIHACSLLNDKPLRFLPFMHAYFQTSRADMTDEQFSKKYLR